MKEEVYKVCIKLLKDRIQEMQITLNDLSDGAKNDTKSSAGDKHETARAMMQLEQEKIGKQLNEVLKQKAVLDKIDVNQHSKQIIKGSLVKTKNIYLFIAAALGKVTVNKTEVVVLSPESPLGLKLMGLKKGDTAEINSVKYLIEQIS